MPKPIDIKLAINMNLPDLRNLIGEYMAETDPDDLKDYIGEAINECIDNVTQHLHDVYALKLHNEIYCALDELQDEFEAIANEQASKNA